MTDTIYLDNSATTPIMPGVKEAVITAMENSFGNPSSLHGMGVEAEKQVDWARSQVASLLKVKSKEIYFTSGGTEANNWVFYGISKARHRYGKHIITSVIEHPAVLAACRRLEEEGCEITYLPVDSYGLISLEKLEKALRPDTILVSIMSVNNEIGSIQPLGEITRIVRHRSGALVHTDHVQGFGKIPLNCEETKIDLVSVSAHKIHGPKGTGALYIKDGIHIEPLLVGGDQEKGKRAGTENTPGIAGFGKAAEITLATLDQGVKNLKEMKMEIAEQVINTVPGAVINGPPPEAGAPHILNFSFPGIKAEVLVHMLELRKIYISTGAACHSRNSLASHVLKALHLSNERVDSAVRVSLGALNKKEEINPFIDALRTCIEELRAL